MCSSFFWFHSFPFCISHILILFLLFFVKHMQNSSPCVQLTWMLLIYYSYLHLLCILCSNLLVTFSWLKRSWQWINSNTGKYVGQIIDTLTLILFLSAWLHMSVLRFAMVLLLSRLTELITWRITLLLYFSKVWFSCDYFHYCDSGIGFVASVSIAMENYNHQCFV